MPKTIAIVGATGNQGGGLARAILADGSGEFSARAITRNASSESAQALADAGAEVVQADIDDEASLDRAFEGAHGAYLVTNFWEHFSAEKETAQARALADATKKAGVSHVVWSTLEDTRDWCPLDDDRMPTLQGKYKVPHFDAKGEANAYFAEIGVPTTYLWTVFYWDNLVGFGMGPQPDEDGNLALNLPMADKKLPGIAVEDIGRCAFGIFREGERWIGERIGIAGEHLTGKEMAAALAEALGRPVRYNAVPFDVYRGLGFPGADDLGNMFQFKAEFNEHFTGSRDVELARRLNQDLQSFADWLAANASKLDAA